MKYMVAPSYANAEIKAINVETHKALIEDTCDRCGGSGIIVSRIENGQPIPIPVDNGICYKCNGVGKIQKWVKAYTEEEYDKYCKAQTARKESLKKKEEQRKQDLINNSETNRKTILKEKGFDPENPTVYIVAGGNTYHIKNELKNAGCRFERALGWYSASPIEVPAPYYLVPLAFNKVFHWNPIPCYFSLIDDAKKIVQEAVDATLPTSESEYIGEEKERLRDLPVTVSAIHTTEGFYGTTFIYSFEMNKNVLVWMTSSYKDIEVGETLLLTGTVKEHKEYRNVKQTILSRCIIKKEG